VDNLPSSHPAVTNITNIIYNFNLTPNQSKNQPQSTKHDEGKRSPTNKQRPHTSKQASSLAVGEAKTDEENDETDSPAKIGATKLMSTLEDGKKRGQDDLIYDKQVIGSGTATIGAHSNSSAKQSNRKRPHTGSLNPRGGPAEPTPV
jgi:hypothetical protein